MKQSMQTALEDIIFYDQHEEWLKKMADDLEKSESNFSLDIDTDEWHTEKHTLYMLLVGMFGDWGTSIRSGWIEETKECAKYIRYILKRACGT